MSPSTGFMIDDVALSFKLPENINILLETTHVPHEDLGSHLHSVKSEITRVEALAEQIQHELSRMKAHVNRLSTMSRLPAEVLAEIFQYSTPYNVNPKMTTQRELLSPLFLGAVCKEWRDIAWTTPYIWTSVSILISGAKRYPIQVGLLQGWLQRARGLPLTINLEFNIPSAFDGNWSDAAAERNDPASIIKLLLDYSNQWKSIDFFLESSWYHHFENLGRHFPLLESASFRRERLTREPTWTVLDILASCPKLHDLYIQKFTSSDFALVQWKSLQSVAIACSTAEDTEYILSRAKNVKDVYISDIYRQNWVGNSLDQLADITLPELVSFAMTETSAQDICLIMGRLTLPKVQDIQLATPRPEPDSIVDERFDCIDFGWNFKRWSKAWKSTLTSIKIEGVLRETSDLLRGLGEFPSLQIVEIENYEGQPLDALLLARALIEGTEVLEGLVSADWTFQPVLPSLRQFKYTGPVHVARAQQVVEALYFRWKLAIPASLSGYVKPEVPGMANIKQLKEFTIVAPDTPPITLNNFVHYELLALAEEGLDVDINMGGKMWVEPIPSD
ncbi:hypothetical protein BDQ17DRAFT_1541030 [Cyathus striatus]|nr:hypothetical protein BDQ17DRAFT_1541030 [Cyathus striatus]